MKAGKIFGMRLFNDVGHIVQKNIGSDNFFYQINERWMGSQLIRGPQNGVHPAHIMK